MPGSPALEPHVLFLASSQPALGWADRPAEAETARILVGLAYHAPRVVSNQAWRARSLPPYALSNWVPPLILDQGGFLNMSPALSTTSCSTA
jgi:hypothetical protein